MLGLRFSRLVHAAIAGGSLTMTGCVDRLIVDPSLGGFGTDSGGDTDTMGTDTNPTDSDPTDPTDPTNPTNPTTDPTDPTNPTDPTDPTDPTGPDPMPGPPMLIDVQVLEPNLLELYFSEPMSDPGSIDASKFRLSVGFSQYYEYYGGTYYQEVGQFTGEQVCNEYCYCDYYNYEYCYDEDHYTCNEYCYQQPGPPVLATGLSLNQGAPSRMLLTLNNPITPGVCDQIDQLMEFSQGGGLYLHYTNNGSPTVVDSDGEVLDAIAEHWTLPPLRDFANTEGYFPAMQPFIPIACPF